MPKNKSAAIRYRIIDANLNSKKHRFPSLTDLAEKCSAVLGVAISTSTIEKDIAEMRKPPPHGYSAPIVYSKTEKGYIYGEMGFSIAELNLEEEEWNALQFASQLLYQYKEVPIFTHFKEAIERINMRFSLGIDGQDALIDEIVQFEKSIQNNGMELIQPIYESIKKKQGISFDYRNIYKEKAGPAFLIPYLLKEHRNRWYVIGWSEEKQKYTTYALDRMRKLTPDNHLHTRRADFDADHFFQFSIGIMESNTKPEDILLTIKKPVSDLILLEPLHASQKLLEEKIDSISIQLKVLVNEEFLFQLLGMGAHCIVEHPIHLRKKLEEIIQCMQANYL